MRKLPILALVSAFLAGPAIAGGNVLFSESFDDTAFGARGWYDNLKLQVTTSEHIADSKGSAYFRFRKGATVPDSGGGSRHRFTATDQVFVRYWVKYSGNWEGSNKPYHPHEFYLLTNKDGDLSGLAETHLTAYIEQNEGRLLFALQDTKNVDIARVNQNLVGITEYRGANGCNGDADPYKGNCYAAGSVYRNEKKIHAPTVSFQDSAGPNYKGDWHKVEAFVKLNTINNGKGLTDGIVRYWVDGKLVMDRSNVLMRTAKNADMKFNQFIIGPYIGVGSPVDQTFWVDELMVADDVISSGDRPKAPILLEVK